MVKQVITEQQAVALAAQLAAEQVYDDAIRITRARALRAQEIMWATVGCFGLVFLLAVILLAI